MSAKLERFARDMLAKASRLEVPKAMADTFGPYKDEPVRFGVEVLGVTSATRRSSGAPYQFDVLADLATYDRVAVRSGHGIGKSALDAWAVLWFLLTRPMSRVVVLAPEHERQIKAVIFSEIRRWARRSKVALPVKVETSRVVVEGHGPEWGAIGASTAGDTDRLEGFHGEGGLLLLVDEMKGVPADAFDAVQGALTGDDAKVLVTSVPGGAGAGPFWKVCQDTARWHVHHVPADDSSLVSPKWVADRAREWGNGSPLYESRVLGQFASAGDGVLFPLALLEAAVGRVVELPDKAPVHLGVDVARSIAGDMSAIAVKRGPLLERVEVFRLPDTMACVERVLHALALTGARACAVDMGGVGSGVGDRLRQLGKPVAGVFFGGASSDPRRWANRRAEMFWRLRELLEAGKLALPADDELVADLSALRYGFDAKGRIVLESKDDCRTRLGRSPDRADAVALAASADALVGIVDVSADVLAGLQWEFRRPSYWPKSDWQPD